MNNIAVLVSGGGTNLQALIDAQNRGEIKNGKITCVISSNANAYALKRAEQNGIATKVLVRKDFIDIKSYTKAVVDELKNRNADVVVYAGFMSILDIQAFEAYPYKMINVHPSLIPSFCGQGFYGLKVHEEAIKRGVKLTGATVHFVTEVCDGGPIILQKSVKIQQDDTAEVLQKRVMEQAEWDILPKAVSLLCEQRIEVKGNRTYIKE